MNCEQVNQMDMVEYLTKLGYSPSKIRGTDHWYLSPLRSENTPSFKVNKSKNIWYDHGIGQGGTLIDFICALFSINIAQALEKIQEQGMYPGTPPFNPNPMFKDIPESPLKILSVSNNIKDMNLLRYLTTRNIDKQVVNEYCRQVLYENAGKRFTAIGFKNNSGGYELRSENFKGSASPKYVSYFNNKENTITVFEGFFDFLTHQSIHQKEQTHTNFLVLNSLSFFTRSLLLMEKHEKIHLYLDNDKQGQECVKILQERSEKVIDESRLYKGYKDLNEWTVGLAREQKLNQPRGLRF